MKAALAALVFAVACGSSAKELLDTAEFEELQRNTTHARELYQEIVRTHPGSPEAMKATERLQALDAAS
jgi:TolA-binding protein